MNASEPADAVVGAGIVGLAVAYHLAKSGRRVEVFERHPRPQGASVRNFGLIWPIGQPDGRRRATALRSRAIWADVLGASGIWHAQVGSLHLAYHADELQVLEEFADTAARDDFACELVPPDRVRERSPLARQEGLRGGLYSPHEIVVDPRDVAVSLPRWLEANWPITFRFGTLVQRIEGDCLQTPAGAARFGRCFVCAGDELQVLYPDALASLGLHRCKLQMMRTSPLGWRIGPPLAAGLTLGHYDAFAGCPSLPALKQRFATELPDHVRFGIHVMVSQTGAGELTIGDSHEYDEAITPFDNPAIDRLVLEYLRSFADLDGVEIASRWHGVYVRHPHEPFCVLPLAANVIALVGFGGAGMTLSFGAAEEAVAIATANCAPPSISSPPAP